ncbi:hypothetical protein [Arthrobacter sp. 18067]|uniref:hypothetical protein n=1 Tax=Arthrobacter sp. 18067 TaxID=2681413 RepID=UPI0013575F78|nr:hypothetical protein [Arthrobacter sp. 18067]
MFFLLLALAIFAAVIAGHSLALIARVALGGLNWTGRGAFLAHAGYVAGFGTLAVWLFRLALGL